MRARGWRVELSGRRRRRRRRACRSSAPIAGTPACRRTPAVARVEAAVARHHRHARQSARRRRQRRPPGRRPRRAGSRSSAWSSARSAAHGEFLTRAIADAYEPVFGRAQLRAARARRRRRVLARLLDRARRVDRQPLDLPKINVAAHRRAAAAPRGRSSRRATASRRGIFVAARVRPADVLARFAAQRLFAGTAHAVGRAGDAASKPAAASTCSATSSRRARRPAQLARRRPRHGTRTYVSGQVWPTGSDATLLAAASSWPRCSLASGVRPSHLP